ncbi:MAG: TRAP transporter substrate-binding protein DctP [Elusimicrobia bacterium]|nr:TRAP transporter substrate-binding protein DctP [Elusimicrobiota bacterium]
MNIFNRFAALILILISFKTAQAQTAVKFATLAPEGTSWTKTLRQFADEVKNKTSERVIVKIYSGGISGDEKDVVRKIRIGQLNAAGFTGFGIGEIAPEIRVLDAPFLFSNSSETDKIYSKFSQEFEEIFLKKGFVLLGWCEVGEVYVFSKSPIEKMSDFSKIKMWLWEGDPIAEETFKELKANLIPLSITDVMTSLQTGMIDAVYGTPNTIIPLQWHSKMKYALDLPITNASGAILISKKTLDSMQAQDSKVLTESAKKYFKNLNDISRKENAKAVQTLKSKGIIFIKPSPQETQEFKKAGESARKRLASKVYPSSLLEKIEKELSKK